MVGARGPPDVDDLPFVDRMLLGEGLLWGSELGDDAS